MTDEAALLAAIAARPDDDTPRLVYADWLDDAGADDRAEFIRLQCALARGGPDDPAAAERADELEERHRIRWLAGVPTGPGLRWSFHRGFPERLEADVYRLIEWYRAIEPLPLLRDLCLTGFTAYAARVLVTLLWPAGLVGLELWFGPAGPADVVAAVRAIATCRQGARLRELRLGGDPLPPDAVLALTESPHLSGLRLLAVPGDPTRPVYALLRERFGLRLVGEGA